MLKIPRIGSFIDGIDITEERIGSLNIDRAKVEKYSGKSLGSSGSIRISNGYYYTKEDFEKRRREILKDPFP